MAVTYKLVHRKDMTKGAAEGAKRYYAQSYASGRCNTTELCETIADRSTATAGDVKLVIDGLVHVLSKRLAAGQIVQLGDLGYFQASLGSSGVVVKDDFNADLIKTRKIRFTPGIVLKNVIRQLKTERSGSTPAEEGNEGAL